MIIRRVKYFETPGRENTKECVESVKEAIKAEKYKHVVLATTTGDTGLAFGEGLKGMGVNIVAVTHSAGFKEPNASELSDDVKKKIEGLGVKIFTGSMLTHSLEKALAAKFSGIYPTMIIGQTLKCFGPGSKVCCEIVLMAVDAGLVPEGEEILAVAGTARGADTVLLIKSTASKRFLDLRVLEVLAKPRV
jgi:hypothetical protein